MDSKMLLEEGSSVSPPGRREESIFASIGEESVCCLGSREMRRWRMGEEGTYAQRTDISRPR